MLSPAQLKRYWMELRAARVDDRAAFHAQHNLPASTKEFTREHFDAFLAACRALTQPSNLKPQLRALNQPKTRLLHKILVEQAAQLDALYEFLATRHSPLAPRRKGAETILHICHDKFRGRKPADLSADKRPSLDPNSPLATRPSELETLLYTVARAISELRQEAGWTVHELLWQSGLGKTCACADCQRRSKVGPAVLSGPLEKPELVADPF